MEFPWFFYRGDVVKRTAKGIYSLSFRDHFKNLDELDTIWNDFKRCVKKKS